MRGIILAGGKGTRLLPLTKVTNKHLLPIYDKPMIYYPIKTLVDSGITDIMIITGEEHAGDFISLLGSGKDFNAHFTYRVQKEADGIAGAIALAEDFANKEKIAVLLGDNIFQSSVKMDISIFNASKEIFTTRADIFVKAVPDPERFGVVEFGKEHRVISIEEKPEKPKSIFAQTGLYLYDKNVFDYIRELTLSTRGEYEVTDLNNLYMKKGFLKAHIVSGYWQDAGTFKGLFQINKIKAYATKSK